MQQEKLDALVRTDDTKPGDLAHANWSAQQFIHKYQKHTRAIQVTGRLRRMEIDNYTDIEIIAYPQPTTDLLGANIPKTNQLQHAMSEGKPKIKFDIQEPEPNASVPIPPYYIWKKKHYQWTVYIVQSHHALTIAQLILSSGPTFNRWITSTRAHKHGALPWGYTIQNMTLVNNNRKPVNTKNEKQFFDAIGYSYITMLDREIGGPPHWETFKIQDPDA
jgi:DNA polymerase/3'-5' exonuclease PolX